MKTILSYVFGLRALLAIALMTLALLSQCQNADATPIEPEPTSEPTQTPTEPPAAEPEPEPTATPPPVVAPVPEPCSQNPEATNSVPADACAVYVVVPPGHLSYLTKVGNGVVVGLGLLVMLGFIHVIGSWRK